MCKFSFPLQMKLFMFVYKNALTCLEEWKRSNYFPVQLMWSSVRSSFAFVDHEVHNSVGNKSACNQFQHLFLYGEAMNCSVLVVSRVIPINYF